MTATAYLVGLLDTRNLATPIVFDIFSEESPTVEGVAYRRPFVVAHATHDTYDEAVSLLLRVHPWAVALAPRAIRIPEGGPLAAGYHAAGIALQNAGFKAGTLVDRVRRVLKLADELRAERDTARMQTADRSIDAQLGAKVVEFSSEALKRIAVAVGAEDVDLVQVPDAVEATLASLSAQLDEAHTDTAHALLRIDVLTKQRDDLENRAVVGGAGAAADRDFMETEIAALTAEVRRLIEREAVERQENERLTKERDRLRKLFDDVGGDEHNTLALVDFWQSEVLTARADVERLTKERDEAVRMLGYRTRAIETGLKVEGDLSEQVDALRAENARHLETIRALRTEKLAMEDALFNLRNDIPDAIGEAYSRGISDGHPICNMPTGVKDIAKALLEHIEGDASREYEQPQHPDDVAVSTFAEAMREKLAKKRADGRSGWQDKTQCTAEMLSTMLRDHVEKGDPVDVGNLAMMLHQRGERIAWSGVGAAPNEAKEADDSVIVDRGEHLDLHFGMGVGSKVAKAAPLPWLPGAHASDEDRVFDAAGVELFDTRGDEAIAKRVVAAVNSSDGDAARELWQGLNRAQSWIGNESFSAKQAKQADAEAEALLEKHKAYAPACRPLPPKAG